MSCENYIYLLKPLLSITNNENVYKIGKTHRNNLKRFSEYPIGSKLIIQLACTPFLISNADFHGKNTKRYKINSRNFTYDGLTFSTSFLLEVVKDDI